MVSADALTISSVEQVYRFYGRGEPAHPHIAVIGAAWQPPMSLAVPIGDRTIHSGLYSVGLKRGDECRLAFGRQVHDAQAGTLLFLAPGQTFTPLPADGSAALTEAWTVLFHPDLLKTSDLSTRIREYGFFRYAIEEALHLDDDEQEQLTQVVRGLDREASAAPDAFSADVLIAQVELLLGYCRRFYARQFQTRAAAHGGIAQRLERHLADYLGSTRARAEGLPTVASCAKSLGYSADYLSDLVREETGDSTRDHIHRTLIEAAKRRLAGSNDTVSEIAYELGFVSPQHFSRLFKRKAGCSPGQWRS